MRYLEKIIIVSFLLMVAAFPASAALKLDGLPPEDIQKVQELIMELDPLIKERDAKQNLSTLTFDELYAPLNAQQKSFLKEFENLDAKELKVKIPFRGMATGKEELTIIKDQKVKVHGKEKETNKEEYKILPPQFLPPNVYQAYLTMMDAMKKDIGKRLYVDSGYRSSAYQLYLFVYYLKNHKYSIRETVKWVALPGYSEHGAPKFQAIDFINADGINGDDNIKEFEDLPEYAWLLKNAGQFGFVISYPKDAPVGITYEPWHWRYESK